MHALLRERLWRKLEALPEDRVYQVLDYVEFLESKYAPAPSQATGARRFAERLEDTMRARRMASSVISGTMDVVGIAARMVDGVTDVGRALVTGESSASRSANSTGGTAAAKGDDEA